LHRTLTVTAEHGKINGVGLALGVCRVRMTSLVQSVTERDRQYRFLPAGHASWKPGLWDRGLRVPKTHPSRWERLRRRLSCS